MSDRAFSVVVWETLNLRCDVTTPLRLNWTANNLLQALFMMTTWEISRWQAQKHDFHQIWSYQHWSKAHAANIRRRTVTVNKLFSSKYFKSLLFLFFLLTYSLFLPRKHVRSRCLPLTLYMCGFKRLPWGSRIRGTYGMSMSVHATYSI